MIIVGLQFASHEAPWPKLHYSIWIIIDREQLRHSFSFPGFSSPLVCVRRHPSLWWRGDVCTQATSTLFNMLLAWLSRIKGVRIGKSLGNKVEVSFYPASQIITFRLTADYISNSKRRELMVVDPICIKFFSAYVISSSVSSHDFKVLRRFWDSVGRCTP